jgi:hypothetical protein
MEVVVHTAFQAELKIKLKLDTQLLCNCKKR